MQQSNGESKDNGRIRYKNSRFGLSLEILNPEFKVGTLNPKTFESGELCRVNDFLEFVVELNSGSSAGWSRSEINGQLMSVADCLILLQSFIMGKVKFLRNQNYRPI